jgi:endoglucanase
LPIFVTEYGTCTATGGGSLDFNEAEKWVKFFNGDNYGNQKISFVESINSYYLR